MSIHHHEFGAPEERRQGFPGRGGFGFGGPRFPGRFGGPGMGGGGPFGRGGMPGFGPGFGPGGPRARRGDVRNAILGLLAEGSYNGYGLIKAIGERTDGAWQPSPGSVYPTLAQLVDEGLIEQADGPRGAYSLTDAGRTHVQEHGEQIASAFDTAGGRFGGDDDLRIAVGKLMGVAGQFRFGLTPDQRTRAAELVDGLRRDLLRLLAE